MDETQRLIEVPFNKREARVLRLDGDFEIGLKRVVHIQRHDLISWRHDVTRAEVIQGKSIEQNVFFRLGHLFGLLAFCHNVPQFLFRMRHLTFRNGIDAENHAQQPVCGAVKHDDGWFEDNVEELKRPADQKGGAERFADGE